MTIYYEQSGNGKDIVLLNGGLDNHRFFDPIKNHLTKQYCVTWLDQPGIGQSEWYRHINTAHDMIDEILPILPEKAIYLGWSFGGLLGIALASKYPERVEKLITVCSTPKFIASDNWPGVPAPGFSTLMPTVKESGLDAFLTAFIDDEFATLGTNSENAIELKKAIPNNNNVNYDALTSRIGIVDQSDLRNDFSEITCPIDMVFGELDSAIPSEQYNLIKALNDNISIHSIAGAKHMPFQTHRDSFEPLITKLVMA